MPLRDLIAIDPEHLFDTTVLPAPEQVQDSAPSARAVVEAWQLLETDQPGGMARLSLCELGELVLNPFNLEGLAALWTWMHGSQQLFRWRRDRLVALEGHKTADEGLSLDQNADDVVCLEVLRQG